MSRKTDQIAAALKDAIAQTISRGLQDPRIGGLITLTSVTVADDLTEATIMTSVLPAEKQEPAIEGLNAASGYLRKEITRYINMRRIPTLHFKSDMSLKKQLVIMQAINQAAEDLAKRTEASAKTEATDKIEDAAP